MRALRKPMAIGIAVAVLAVVFVMTVPTVVSAQSQTWTSDVDWRSGNLDSNVVLQGTGNAAYLTLRKSDFPDWMRMAPATVPARRDAYCLAWDDADNSIFMFGGRGVRSALGDTWKYDFTNDAWTEMSLATHPSNRSGPGCAFDPVNRVIVLHSGWNVTGTKLADTWEFNVDTNTWAEVFPPGINPRGLENTPMTYDVSAQRIVMIANSLVPDEEQTWAYDAAADTWTNRRPTVQPEPRDGHAISYDKTKGQTFLWSGAKDLTLYCDFWWYSYAANTWTKVRDCITNVDPKPGRVGSALWYRDSYGGNCLFGGYDGLAYAPETWCYLPLTDTWWGPPITGSPGGRRNAAVAHSTVDDASIMFGGYNGGTGGELNDTWAFAKGYVQGISAVWTSNNTPSNAGCDNVVWGNFFFNATKPFTTTVRFQLATSTSPTGPFTFRGPPDGLPGQYYTTSGQQIWQGQNNQRYFRVLAQLRTANGRVAPQLDDLGLTWSCPPTPPYVKDTNPASGRANVPIDAPIWVNFSEAMQTTTVRWTISPAITLGSSWSNGDATLELTHTAPFADCTNYTVQITAGRDANDDLDLIPGPVPNPWTFKTVCIAPYIVTTDPPHGAFGVAVDKVINVTFNEPMQTPSVTWTINPVVSLSPSWNGNRDRLSLGHGVAFAQCTKYTVEITGGIDDQNLSLSPGPVPNPWDFFTFCANPIIVSTVPADGDTGVALNANIVVTFSKAMDTVTVTPTINPVVGLTSSWNSPTNTILTLSHTTPFAELTRYTVQIAGSDTTGRPLVPGLVPNPWSFNTVGVNPTIVSTDPADGARGVPVDKSIVVTFSEPMNTATVSVTINPTIALTRGWNAPTNTVLTLSHALPFAQCTRYTVAVSGNDLQGLPLVAGPVPNPWSFTTFCPLGAPRALTVTRLAPAAILLSWQAVTGATGYKVYETQNRFTAFGSWTLLTPTPVVGTQYTHAGALTDGLTHYYVVRATDGASDGPNSTMGVKVPLSFGFSPSTTNIAWFSLPYVSQYRRASDIAGELGSANIDVVGKWDPAKQSSIVYYYSRGRWRGTDFTISAGDGLYLGTRQGFTWNVVGTDANVSLSFTLNPVSKGNVNWISLPYTGVYGRASDITSALGSTRITEVGLWNPATQSSVRWYWSGTAWTGTDFAIAPGAGVYLIIASTFTWTPTLITPAVP